MVHAACTEEPTGHRAPHARGGAHPKHAPHARNAGRVEAQRLVERRRALPSRTEAHGRRHGGGRREGACGFCGRARSVHGGTDWTLAGHSTRAVVRTRSMLPMPVTLDVSRLSGWLNADAPCRVTPKHVEGDTGVGGARTRGGGAAVQAACTEEPTGHWA
eukprot:scaffold131124_cov63-Phaeocystis_antarctica.AAC.3